MYKKNNHLINTIMTVLLKKDYETRFQYVLEIIGKILFLLIVFTVCLSQVSAFIDFNLNKLNYFLIVVLFAIFLFLNYKETLLTLTRVLVLCLPLIIICFITRFINHSSFLSEMIIMTFSSFLMFSLTYLSKKLFYESNYKFFCCTYLIGCLFFICFALAFDCKLIFVFGNGTYSYFSKNSAAPMLCCGLIFIPYLAPKGNCKSIIYKLTLYGLFLSMIILLRCRSVILCLPIIFLYNIYKCDNKSNEKWIWILLLLILGAVVLFVPRLRNMIIGPFIQSPNGGTSIDDISSGRFTQLFNAFKGFSPLNIFFGKGSGYIDIMPAYLFCYFGIFGFVYYGLVIALLVYVATKTYRSTLKDILIILLLFYIINSFFEAYGMFGPGAKVFAFWGFFGFVMDTDLKQLAFPKKIVKVDSSLKKGFNELKFNQVSLAVLTFFSIGLLLFSLVPSATNTISSSIFSLLPRDGRRCETVSAEAIDIDVEITGKYKTIEMFVGEKRTLTATVLPSEALNKKLYWNTYQPGIIGINHETGEITALSTGYATVVCHINDNRNILDESVRVNVKNGDGIASSVEINAISNLFVSKNESVVFEANVFPNYLNESAVSFKCSDPSLAVINNETSSIVPIVNNVSFDVWGEFLNSDNSVTVSDKITVVVGGGTLNQCDFIELPTFSGKLYEKEIITLQPNVTPGSDMKFKLFHNIEEISIIDMNQIELLRDGQIPITIVSTFDPNVRCSGTLLVESNNLIAIKCFSDWSIVGKLNKMNVKFIYESGLVRIPEATEYLITVSGKKYAEVVSDSCEYFAKVSGTFSGRVISKSNHNIYSYYEITNHTLTKEQYEIAIFAVGCIVELLLLLLLSILLLFFVSFKKQRIAIFAKMFIVIIWLVLSAFFFIFNVKSILCLVLSIILLISTGLACIFVKKKPFNYECNYVKKTKLKTDGTFPFYEIAI